jgi:uroporphyrin-III C-methyltransferase/precorrin-2 dehydrogenase/sirohydrochlorin ferrochelatase
MKLASRKPAEAASRRVEALAKLPVFLDLAGKRAVVAGGSAAAAWKAELLAAAGAHVEIYASEIDSEMAALLERGCASGTMCRYPRPWSVDVLAGASIALADVEDEAEAKAFWCAAKAAGAPVNVVDKPAFCQFQFGSIVNRSPVVVAISTDGAAPILGQSIRRRIETLLPPSLALWGQLAKSVRGEVARRLAKGNQRRAFWERFAEASFRSGAPGDGAAVAARMITDVSASVESGTGSVTLVGAGPGDAELLTLKAVRALQSADIVLYDDLVSDEVLELARREAKRMLVGKRGQRESCRQDDINDLMVDLARKGRRVVRLKSGDAMIFGRAGEEIERLEAEGIPVTVVPGITSASAMASALGVSLTHRDHAHSVRFLTGHACSGELSHDLDWRGLADPETTLVVYMGGRTVGQIAARLIAEGMAATTPVVAVNRVSRPGETRWRGRIGDLVDAGLPDELSTPVLIGIGTVFARLEASDVAHTSYVAADLERGPMEQESMQLA